MAADLTKIMQVMQAMKNGKDGGGDPEKKKQGQQNSSLPPELLENWNRFQDFVASKNMTGSKDLDLRDKKIGMQLIEAYNYYNPKNKINPDDVQKVQSEYNKNYRDWMINATKEGYFGAPVGVKPDYSNFMTKLSPEDNWYGSLTSKYQFDPEYINYKKTGQMRKFNDPSSKKVFQKVNENIANTGKDPVYGNQ